MKKIALILLVLSLMTLSYGQTKKQMILIGSGVALITGGIVSYDIMEQNAANKFDSKLNQALSLNSFSAIELAGLNKDFQKEMKLARVIRTTCTISGALLILGTFADFDYSEKGLALRKNIHLNSEGQFAKLTVSF